MSYKEWEAAIMVAGALVVSAWVAWETTSAPVSELVPAASRLLWAVGAVIVFNILATIIVTVIVSATRRETFQDERADERDRAIAARAMRNGYAVLSVGGLGIIVLLALGVSPILATYALFGAMMLAGATDSASRLLYYRLG